MTKLVNAEENMPEIDYGIKGLTAPVYGVTIEDAVGIRCTTLDASSFILSLDAWKAPQLANTVLKIGRTTYDTAPLAASQFAVAPNMWDTPQVVNPMLSGGLTMHGASPLAASQFAVAPNMWETHPLANTMLTSRDIWTTSQLAASVFTPVPVVLVTIESLEDTIPQANERGSKVSWRDEIQDILNECYSLQSTSKIRSEDDVLLDEVDQFIGLIIEKSQSSGTTMLRMINNNLELTNDARIDF